MLFLIEYESSQWCGGQSHCVVEAQNEEEAVEKAEFFMEESMRELFSSEYEDMIAHDGDAYSDDECAYVVNSVEAFDETHEYWKFYTDETQSQFFPFVE